MDAAEGDDAAGKYAKDADEYKTACSAAAKVGDFLTILKLLLLLMVMLLLMMMTLMLMMKMML